MAVEECSAAGGNLIRCCVDYRHYKEGAMLGSKMFWRLMHVSKASGLMVTIFMIDAGVAASYNAPGMAATPQVPQKW